MENINGKRYHTIEESISIGNRRINKRAEDLFIQAKSNRLKKEEEYKVLESLFLEGKLDVNKFNHYV
ncbi:MAG: hypothetical protein Q8K30_01655 [Candidatus Gracilibacteria bacterium]|nr:hypothetical protein [Candidatus Gracilibacteria bacterium]